MHPIILYIEDQLRDMVVVNELRDTAFYIAEEVTHLSRTELLCGKGTTISPTTQTQLQPILERVRQHEPLQYIFGYTEWRGLHLQISPAVLIPRPETAELVDWILEDTHASKLKSLSPKLIDCGTGSGCIAIALKKERPTWQVTALDISTEALQIAQHNAKTAQTNITLCSFDLLTEDLPTCDVIVSNPPYIRILEKAEMEQNVLAYEPHTALFVSNDDPLLFYRRIAEQKKAPVIYFEINQYLAHETQYMLQTLGYMVTLRNDIFGNPRMIRATL